MTPHSTIREEPTREPIAGGAVDVAVPLGGRPDSDPPTAPGPVSDLPAAAVYVSIAADRYRIGRELGRGGMGIVFEAWDTQLDRPVAVKLLAGSREHPGRIRRFLREARIASRLDHPGVMPIHEFGLEGDGQAFIVMGLLRGHTLRDLLASRADLVADLPRFLNVFLQVCQASAYSHDEGMIHRDLKPGNVMVGDYGMVTIMDWGLAKILGEPDHPEDGPEATAAGPPGTAAEMHTASGTIFGTPNYLAPEQARGENDRVDKRADVFGLGAILCEILTGAAPFSAAATGELWTLAAAGDTGPALARLDACGAAQPVIDLAKRCLAADPGDRPPDARAIVVELTRYLESGQQRAEQQLVQFFDLSVDLFCIASLSGYFRRINDNFSRLLGHSTRDLLSRGFLDFVHPEDRDKTLAEIDRLARGEPTIQFLNRYRHADGQYLWLEWTSRSIPEEGLIYAVARDVTDRVAAAEAHARLEQDRARLAKIVEEAADAIVSRDLDGIVLSWNKAAERLFGYSAAEMIGRPVTALIPPERLHEEREIVTRLREGKRVEHFDTVRIARDGRRLDISVSVAPVLDAAGRFVGTTKIARPARARR